MLEALELVFTGRCCEENGVSNNFAAATSLQSDCSAATQLDIAEESSKCGARDYPDHIKMTTAPLELRSAGSADADDLRCLQPSGGATAACGRFASSSGGWCGTHDQAHSLLDPLQGHQRYTYVRDLHRGGMAFVQLALDRSTGRHVAIKFLARFGGEFDARTVARELANHKMCAGHPHIVQLKEVFLTSHYLAIVMDYVSGGDLSQLIDLQWQQGVAGIAEDDARRLFQEMVIAVDYCHRLGIVNRDIKLDNLMLDTSTDSPSLKICDFGFSKDEAGQSISKSTCGTPEYMAPEVLFEEMYDGKAADIWSCGVSLYVMLTGNFPFVRPEDGQDKSVHAMQSMFTRISRGNYMPLPHLSPECQDLLHRLLRPTPQQRISLPAIMRHPWLLKDLPPALADTNARLLHLASRGMLPGSCAQTSGELVAIVEACVRARVARVVYNCGSANPIQAPSAPTSNPFATQSDREYDGPVQRPPLPGSSRCTAPAGSAQQQQGRPTQNQQQDGQLPGHQQQGLHGCGRPPLHSRPPRSVSRMSI